MRVETFTETLERLAVRLHVGELGGGRGDNPVERREQGTAHRAREGPEAGRFLQGHVAVRQRTGQAEHIGDGVHQEVRADAQAGLVDQGAVLADRDRLGLRTVHAVSGEHPQVVQVVTAQRGGASGQGEVQGRDLVVQRAAQMQHGHTVARCRDQFVVGGEHFGIGVAVVAVGRQGEQVDHTAPELGNRPFTGGVLGQCLDDALHPEGERVGHVGREVDEVDVVLDVVPGHFADSTQRAHRDVDDRLVGQPRQTLQQVRREFEAHRHQGAVELPRRDAAVPCGSCGEGEAVGVPDNQ